MIFKNKAKQKVHYKIKEGNEPVPFPFASFTGANVR